MNGTRKLIAFAALLSMSLTTASAWAADQTAPDREGGSVGILVGYGFDGAYHLGLGARGGYTLAAPKIYIGGSFTYHFGQSNDTPLGSISEHLFYLGAEGGYDLVLGAVPQLLIRPYLGLGYENVSVSTPPVGVPNTVGLSVNGFSFWPSVTGLYSFTPAISAGLDAKVVVITFSGGDTAFVLSLAGQYKF